MLWGLSGVSVGCWLVVQPPAELARAPELGSVPLTRAVSSEMITRGPRVSPGDDPLAALRGRVALHPETQWRTITVPLLHGGALIIAQEFWDELPIAHSRLALRVAPDLRLRQVLGRALAPSTPLPRRAAQPGPRHIWWPGPGGLTLARTERDAPRLVDGQPVAELRVVALADGSLLARGADLDEHPSNLVGWFENPLTTPEPYSVTVELLGAPPLALESEVFRVVHCLWDGELEDCSHLFAPLSDESGQFPEDLPNWQDELAQADPDDPYAAINAHHGAARFVERLLAWGWDPAVWEIVNCEWQQAPPEQCRVVVITNARWLGEESEPVPFNGAVYRGNGEIRMGQGSYADSSYDLEVLVHEFGHHVTRGHGAGEPIGWVDTSRWARDRSALNEGASDVYASFMGQTPELYDYFRNLGGLYLGPRTRDVSIPFRCPENVAGEVHMEGRIWASAMHSIHEALRDAGLGDEDTFPAIFLGANAAIRNYPADQQILMIEAAELLADEVELALGAEAGELARSILDERGLLACDYQIDINSEPSITGLGDPADPLHARFLLLPSYNPAADPEVVATYPPAPAVQFRVTLPPAEDPDAPINTLTVEFEPDRWRTTQPLDEPLDQDGLLVAALVKPGEGPLEFWRDADDHLVNDAEFSVHSQPVEPGATRHQIIIDELQPGTSYAIALVSLTAVSGDSFLIDELQWRLDSTPSPAGSTGALETSGDPSAGPQTDSEVTGSTDSADSDPTVETGCGCVASDRAPAPTGAALSLLLLLAVTSRRRRPIGP